MKNVNLVFFVIAAVFLLSFDLYKASHASFTHDESFTYLHYVSMEVMDIISYRDSEINNHILNTLLMKSMEALFGASEIVLRLPNILAHVLYLVFTFKLFSRYTPKNFILFFILANANPFLIDFFSLARGYGIAIGLMSAGLYYYCRYLENRKQQDHVFSLVFISLAALANFALLHVLITLVLAHNIFEFVFFRLPVSLKNIRKVNAINLLVGGAFSIVFYEPIRRIIRYKLIYVGGETGFWEDIVGSLIHATAYNSSYEEILTVILQLFILICMGLFAVRGVSCYLQKDTLRLTQIFALFLGMIVFFIVIALVAQHIIMGTPFAGGRIAIFMYPLFILMSSFLLEDLWNGAYRYFARGFAFTMAGVFLLNTLFTLNTSYYFEWQYEVNTKDMVVDLIRHRSKDGSNICMGITWLYAPTVNFYRKVLNLNWLSEVNGEKINPLNDYYYLHLYDLNCMPKHESELIRYYSETKSYLILNRKFFFHLKGSNGKYVCADAARNDLVVADRQAASCWETFALLHLDNDKYAIYSYANKFLTAELANHNEITATRKEIADWEVFLMTRTDSGYVAFQAANGKYLSLDEKTLQLYANGESLGKQEKFLLVQNRSYALNPG